MADDKLTSQTTVTVVDAVLTARELYAINELLRSPAIRWAPRVGSAARGNSVQFAEEAMHALPEVTRLRDGLVGRLGAVLSPQDAKLVSTSVVQVFPVLMEPSTTDEETEQYPHSDEGLVDGALRSPQITCVLYVLVRELQGGDLVCWNQTCQADHCEMVRVQPRTNRLVMMPGSQIHSVTPVVRGTRLSIVINFYARHLPNNQSENHNDS
jgi:hypothetical protein